MRVDCNSVFLCVSGASLYKALVLRLLLLAALLSHSSDTTLVRIYYSANKLPQNLAVWNFLFFSVLFYLFAVVYFFN